MTAYNIGDTLFYLPTEEWVTIISVEPDNLLGYLYQAVPDGRDEEDWIYCGHKHLVIDVPEEVEKTFYLLRPERVVAWYGFEVEANTLEEAKNKLMKNDYKDSRLMGIDTGFDSWMLEDAEDHLEEIDESDWHTKGYPNTRGYYNA
jgi:hypothetical protein